MNFIQKMLSAALFVASVPANAAVTYTLTTVPENPLATPPQFSLTVDDFVADFAMLDASVFTSCTFGGFSDDPCTGVWFYSDGPGLGKIILIAENGAESFGYFPTYQHIGTYAVTPPVNYILNTLVISGAPSVPESATWMMLMAGFGVIGAALRRNMNLVVPSEMIAL
jgi:hypothetical protein